MDDIKVSFRSDPDYLMRGLTSDVATIECVYDLIDNSIDAARSELLKVSRKTDEFGLPASYRGFKVELNISSDAVSIKDNCSGIDAAALSERVFTIGVKSSHSYGIGHYGVGLNRAVFKLGREISLVTDNGTEKLTLSFTEDEVREVVKGKSEIIAKRTQAGNKKFNSLEIKGIKPEVFADLGSDTWLDALRKEVRVRYAIFCRKGLKIYINDVEIGKFGPLIRESDVLEKRTQKLVSKTGVKVYLEAGLHQNYRIKGVEDDYEIFKSIIMDLTEEYGWYLVCNDRIMIVADKTKLTGWTTSWHNEYHGFLGWAYYVSEDPSLLPWDSKKTGINTSNSTHVEVLDYLRELANDYRSRNRQLRKRSSSSESPSEQTKPKGNNPGGGGGDSTIRPIRNPAGGAVHTKKMDSLAHGLETVSRSPRLASFLAEAKELSIKESPYTAMVLLRVLFEASLRDYLIRHKHYQAVKDFYIDSQLNQGRSFSGSQKKDYIPSLQCMYSWVLVNSDIFPDDVRRATHTSLKQFNKDVARLNGIIHEDGVLTDYSEAKQIRNNAYKALQTLLMC